MSKKVLVLEDEAPILDLMEVVLGEAGYDVVAINHYEPLEYLMEFDPQIILLDVRLSNGYGHILCHDLKANPLTAGIPVILVSGAANLPKIASDSKADGYLSKPFNVDDLLNCISKFN